MADDELISSGSNSASDDSDENTPAPYNPENALALIEQYESGGRNILQQITSPRISSASGYYQITNSTWRDVAPRAGVDVSKYPIAMSAPKEVQKKAAITLLNERGFEPWSSNKALMNVVSRGIATGQIPAPVTQPIQQKQEQIPFDPNAIFNEGPPSDSSQQTYTAPNPNPPVAAAPQQQTIAANTSALWNQFKAFADKKKAQTDLSGTPASNVVEALASNEAAKNPVDKQKQAFIYALHPPPPVVPQSFAQPQAEMPTQPADATKQYQPPPEVMQSINAYHDKTAQEIAASTGQPMRGASGIYRPTGDGDAVLSSPETEAKLEKINEDRIKQQQNASLDIMNKSLPSGIPSLIAGLASQSQVAKDITGTGVVAVNALLAGIPRALMPKEYGAIEEATLNPNQTIRAIQEGVGGLAAIAPIGMVGKLAKIGLANMGIESGIAETAVAFGGEAIPREAIKTATGQETPGEAIGNVAEAALTGAILHGAGELGSSLAETAKAGRIGSAAIRGTTGAVGMEIPQVIAGQAPDLQSALMGAAFEGREGYKEGAARNNIATLAAENIPTPPVENTKPEEAPVPTNPLEGTPHTATEPGKYQTNDEIVEREIKTGKNAGKTQRGVWADIAYEQAEAITGKRPIEEDGKFFIPEKYVTRPEQPQNAEEVQRTDEGTPIQPNKGNEAATAPVVEEQKPGIAVQGSEDNGSNTVADDAAHVKIFITKSDESNLRDLGYSQKEIDVMKPEEAGRILQNNAGQNSEPIHSDLGNDRGAQTEKAVAPIQKIEGIDASYRQAAIDGELEDQRLDISPDKEYIFKENGINPKADRVTIYRQSPGDIRPGDFAALSERHANLHRRNADDVLWKKEVPVSDLIQGADQNEVIYAPKGEINNATAIGDIESNGIEQHRRTADILQEEGQDRSIDAGLSGSGKEASNSNSAIEETPVAGERVGPRSAQETIAWQEAHPDFPINNGSSAKEIRDYAIRNRIPTLDENGNKIGLATLLDKVRDQEDVKTKPASSGGVLYSSVIGLTPETIKAIGEGVKAQAKGTFEGDIKPKILGFVDLLRGTKADIQKITAPQTIKTEIDPDSIKPRDLDKQEFSYNGDTYRVKSELQSDKSIRNAYYQKTGDTYKRITGASEDTRATLNDAAKEAYIDKLKNSAPQTAYLMRDIMGTQKRNVAIRDKEVEDLRNVFSHYSKDENTAFISGIMRGNTEFGSEVKNQGAQLIRKLFREQGERVMNEAAALGKDIHFDLRDSFFSLLWKKNPESGSIINSIFAKRPLEGSKYFLNKKIFSDITEGIEKGLEPKYDNPFDFLMHYVGESEKLIGGLRATKGLKDMGLGRFAANRKNAPVGWVKVDALAKYGKNENGELVKRGDFYAPHGAAQVLNNYFSQGLGNSAAYRGWMTLSNHLNQLQLALSGFHATFVTMESVMSQASLGLREMIYGVSHKNARDFIAEGARTVLNPLSGAASTIGGSFTGKGLTKAVRTEWLGKDSGSELAKQIADVLMRGGFEGAMPQDYKTAGLRQTREAFKADNAFGGIVRGLFAGLEYPTKQILEKYVPMMKFNAAAQLADFELRKFSAEHGRNASPEEQREIGAKIVDVVDDRFGLLAYDNLLWDKTFKHTVMGLTRSVGWNYGVLRTMIGGATDYAKNITRAIGKTGAFGSAYKQNAAPEFTQRMAYLTAMPMIIGVIGGMTNFLLTGEEPKDLKDFFFPRTGGVDENGNPSRISLPSYMSDAIHLATHPLRTMANKASPAITFFNNILSNSDWQNREIVSHDISAPSDILNPEALKARGRFALEQFFPFPVKQIQQAMSESGTAKGLLPLVGIKPAPPWLNKTSMQEYLSERANARMSAEPKSEQSATQSQVAGKIENLYRQGKVKEANDLANSERAKGTISPDRIIEAYKGAHYSTKESQLQHAPLPDAMTAYFEKADSKELRSLGKQMTQKLGEINLYNLTPSVAKKYSDQLTQAEKEGKTQFLDQRTYRSIKKSIDSYAGGTLQRRIAPVNFGPVRAPGIIR